MATEEEEVVESTEEVADEDTSVSQALKMEIYYRG